MLVDALLEAAEAHGGSLAVADPMRRFTYQRLGHVAAALARVVEQATDCPRVGIMLPASAAFPGVLFGTLWAGRTPVPLNFLLSAEELRHIVTDAGLDVVISVRHFEKLLSELPVRPVYLEEQRLKWRVVAARLRRMRPVPQVQPDDTAVLLYTSGTWGVPKGVELSHRNLLHNCRACIEAAQIDREHTFLNVLPPFHVFGLTANVLVPVVLGASVYAIPRFQPAAALRAIRDQRLSVIMAIPTMYAAMLRSDAVDDTALASVYLAISGGEPLPEAVAAGYERRFGVKLRQGYGLTETSPVVSLCSVPVWRDGSVGRPIPGVEVRILDERQQACPVGTDGEIAIRGPCVMKGYYGRPVETAATVDADGWFRTGDIGRIDEDGFLYITGRKKEMIIVGGENVIPAEIEHVLLRHAAVVEAAVVGTADPSRGEVPVAYVVCLPGTEAGESFEQELRAFARQHLAGHKVPRRIHIAAELPHGPTGKILKRKLIDRA